jgi:hypothetical protein
LKLTLLARASCHLCDEMLAAVLPLAHVHGATVEVIDVDAAGNASLEAVWGDLVPALFAGAPASATLLCHYHLDVGRVAIAVGAPIESPVADGNPL